MNVDFFAVPGNGQALLGMPDTDMLNIILINIHAIGAEDARDSNQYTNMHTIQGPTQDRKQMERISAVKTWTSFQNQQTITQSLRLK